MQTVLHKEREKANKIVLQDFQNSFIQTNINMRDAEAFPIWRSNFSHLNCELDSLLNILFSDFLLCFPHLILMQKTILE